MKRLVLVLLALFTLSAQAGEIIYGWNKKNPTGRVWDLKFMPDNDYFIIATDSTLEIRATETGDSVISYLKQNFYYCAMDFTSDSTKLVLINGPKIELRNLTDMSIIAQDSLISEFPNFDKNFLRLAVDPVKPLAYCITMNIGDIWSETYKNRKIVVYNYNTMQQQSALPGSENQFWEIMAISKDGKYLAAITQLKSKLVVWSLETMQVIRDMWLIDPNTYTSDIITGQGCMKFSEINTDKIYYSGSFPQTTNDNNHSGLFVYSIDSSRIIDSTFGVGDKRFGQSRLCIFDTEKRLLNINQTYITVLDLINNEVEFKRLQENDGILRIGTSVYSNKKNRFASSLGTYLKEFQYDPLSGIIEKDTTIQTVYPNPTTGELTIPFSGLSLIESIVAIDVEGREYKVSYGVTDAEIAVDAASLPAGVYFIRIEVDGAVNSYKFVKE